MAATTTSTKRVLKYPLFRFYQSRETSITIKMAADAKPIHVALQGDVLALWTEVSYQSLIEGPTVQRTFEFFGTGTVIPSTASYLGTVHHEGLVWHLYETTPEQQSQQELE